MDEQIDETAHKGSRAASAVGDVIEDGVAATIRAAKHGACAATELVDDTKKRFQQYPFETVAMTFAAGLATGAAIGWMMRRRKS